MRIMMIGYGVVARNFHKIIERRREELKKRYGIIPKLIAVCDRGGYVYDRRGLNYEKLSKVKKERGTVAAMEGGIKGAKGIEMIEDVEAEVLIEASVANFQTGQPAMDHLMTAFGRRIHVITSNKSPLALAMPSLQEMARHYGVEFLYSGTVGGGTPFLSFTSRALRGNRVLSLKGILNGTSNFILTQMATKGWTMEQALLEARKLGIAEEDPTLDIGGFDAAAKLVILSNHAMGTNLTLSDVRISGIDGLTPKDIERELKVGRTIKLIASSYPNPKVEPEGIRLDSPLNVGGTLNAVAFEVEDLGELVVVGKGAGGLESANSLLRDLVELKDRLALRGV
jgi:homoserine dehydrogenase